MRYFPLLTGLIACAAAVNVDRGVVDETGEDVGSNYACGWPSNDPGDLASAGSAVGDVIENLTLVDQCGEDLKLWDLAGEYHILFMTAAW